jgi:hypothetical protein
VVDEDPQQRIQPPGKQRSSGSVVKRLGKRLDVVDNIPPSPAAQKSKGVELRLERQQQRADDPDDLKLWDETTMTTNGSASTDTRSIKPRRRRRDSKRRSSNNNNDKTKDNDNDNKLLSKRRDKKDKKEKSKNGKKKLFSPSTPERPPSTKSPHYGTPDTVIIEEEEDYDEDDCDWFGESEYYASIEVISKLRDKDLKDVILYVDDYDPSTFQLLIENLLENTGLTAVKVYRLQEHNNRRIRSTPEMARLFSALRALRNLEKLELCNMEEAELEMITSIIKRHPTLTHFRLHYTHGGVDTDFLQALVGAPLLGNISLEIHKSFPMRILFESKTLQHLSVWSHLFKFQDVHFVAAMQILEHNDTLLTLDLKPRISSLAVRALSFAIDENKGLTTLKFSFRGDTPQGDQVVAGKMLLHLAHALTRNSKLQVIQNYSAKQVQVSAADEARMMELLESNNTIEQLEIFDDYDCVSFKERLLRDNKDRRTNGKGFFAEFFSGPCVSIFQCGDECGEDFDELD